MLASCLPFFVTKKEAGHLEQCPEIRNQCGGEQESSSDKKVTAEQVLFLLRNKGYDVNAQYLLKLVQEREETKQHVDAFEDINQIRLNQPTRDPIIHHKSSHHLVYQVPTYQHKATQKIVPVFPPQEPQESRISAKAKKVKVFIKMKSNSLLRMPRSIHQRRVSPIYDEVAFQEMNERIKAVTEAEKRMEQDMTTLFIKYDTNNDGYITVSELMSAIKDVSFPKRFWSCEDILEALDAVEIPRHLAALVSLPKFLEFTRICKKV